MGTNKKIIQKRKMEHLNIVKEKDITYESSFDGFDRFNFINNSLPEIDYDIVDTGTEFLGYRLSFPLIISAIGGGEKTGDGLNRDMAHICNEYKIAFEVGSIRPFIDGRIELSFLKELRKICQNNPIIANLGAVQVKKYKKDLPSILNDLGYDCFCVHLNPLHEAIQPEGEPYFSGVHEALIELKSTIEIPIMVKEVGTGIYPGVVERLMNIGINYINIAGAGGTSWAKVESERIKDPIKKEVAKEFFSWGIPTAEILTGLKEVSNEIVIIATGGIDSGIKFSKALALGAYLAGGSRIFLQKWFENGRKSVEQLIKIWNEVLKISMFCTGCKNINEFRGNDNIIFRRE